MEVICSYYVDRMSFTVCEYYELPSEDKLLNLSK